MKACIAKEANKSTKMLNLPASSNTCFNCNTDILLYVAIGIEIT